jgi:glycosyltransferase involved in cell wall biosynthesis
VARARGLKFFFWLSFPYPEADRVHARDGDTRFPLLANLRGIVSAWLLYKWILPRCDHAFVQSARMKQDISAHGIAPESLTPVPMGIDLQDMPPPAPRAQAGGAADTVLGYLGALNADRRIDMLIDMLAELRRGNHPVRLLLVGDAYEPADREALQQRARNLGIESYLEITGNLPRLEALARMRTVDIALSPYFPTPMFLSTSPTKLVEYLALGLPVVASQHPEQRAILSESGAGICAPWGARHFARSVRWLLRRGRDECSQMGARGRNWVQVHRTYGRVADDLECKYLELLGCDTAGFDRSTPPPG